MKIGEVVYVKTSEEPVLVVGTRKLETRELGGTFPEVYSGSGEVVVVRRPQMTEATGIKYVFFDFLKEELESSEEQTQRLYAKILERQKIAMADASMEPLNRLVKPS